MPTWPAQLGREVTLETKFHPPGIRKEWVDRPELIAYMSSAPRLVLVSAPVGFGKTTLVAQWRASATADRRFAWISVEKSDNDPVRLWRHVVRGLLRACSELDADELRHASAARIPDIMETVLPLLVNELAELSSPAVLVLDDYDVISEPDCHDQVAFLLAHLPPSAQVVLITRTLPPLPLPRMRASGQMVEIGASELRFGAAAAAELVRGTSGVELGDPDLSVLIERTEGWASGLYLAALSLRNHPSPSAFIRQFTGDAPFVVDLLAEEVLDRQPTEIREFLARTSILGRFCARLCDAVLESDKAASIIDVLERENLFIVPLDETRQWFRYHYLFAQVLRSRLAATEPGLVPALHDRASAWHRESGSADKAIRHAVAAGDLAGAVDLIAHHWFGYVDSGRVAIVRGWIRSLGDDHVGASPVAAHCAAWVAALCGEQDAARRWLPVIETGQRDGPLPDGSDSLRASAALLRSSLGFGGIADMRASAATAVTLETDLRSPWRSLAQATFSAALYFCGELESAAAQAQDALLSMASFPVARVLACTVLSLVGIEQGRLNQAEQRARSAHEIAAARDTGLVGKPQGFLAYAATGAVHAAHGRLQEARSDLERALRIRERGFLGPWYATDVQLRLAGVLTDLGDSHAATALIDDARNVLALHPSGAGPQQARLGVLERQIEAGHPATAIADQLTNRELSVLRLLCGALSLRAIGTELSLSPNTIKTHVRAIYRKLGVNTRGDAVQAARAIHIV